MSFSLRLLPTPISSRRGDKPMKPIRIAAALVLAACSSVPDSPVSKESIRALSQGKADRTSRDYCAEYGWYGDGECDDFCPQRDPDCATDARQPELGNDATIVLHAATSMASALAV